MKRLANIPRDKLLHSFYGSLIFSISLIIFNSNIALLIVISLAVGKEVYDYMSKKGNPELLDIVYTLIVPIIIYLSQI